MYKSQHYKFITTPLSKILEDSVNASRGIGNGIETYPLCDYIMQLIFLKMTGTQEQKMKCICWDMATNDYGYRYEYLKKNYGECSTYDAKKDIYHDLASRINREDCFDMLNTISVYGQEEMFSFTDDDKNVIKQNYIYNRQNELYIF